MKNPFTPTFGLVPPYLAGRERLLSMMRRAFANWPGDPNLSTLIVGPRGSGKTAMLSCIGDEARREGWIVADAASGSGLLEDIYQRTAAAAAQVLETEEKKKLTGVNLGQILGLSWTIEEEKDANWRSRMSLLLKQLGQKDIGLLITIDEVQASEEEMVRLASDYQLLIREGAKLALVMAGLPFQVSGLISDKRVSFLRRCRQQILGRISDAEIRSAFRKTVEAAGKKIDPGALSLAVTASGGFAYMMQLVGYWVFDASGDREVITPEDARRGISDAEEDFRNGVLASTWRELSKMDRLFLAAMLPDPNGSSLSEIARRMKKKPGYAYTYKKRLLQAGAIEELSGDSLIFAIPGLRNYTEEQTRPFE